MKLWSGRFEKNTSRAMEDFNSSIHFDQRLFRQDIAGSLAHVRMLARTGVLSQEDAVLIETGLKGILTDMEAGRVELSANAEDIHMNIEKILISRIGETGKKLHTARSRNDQVALDMRMYIKVEIKSVISLATALAYTLLKLAGENTGTIMPGYTHLQRAQPVTLAHHLIAWVEMLRRDVERLNDSRTRVDRMPLGSCALAGTTYPLDRKMVADDLGFAEITRNSMDAVSDRDFVLETVSALSILMMHLSRFSEEIILWSSLEFGFLELDDGYSTGSSIMPQKKNPDVAELTRGKTGRVFGDLMTLLTVMKGLPLAYNKDMQE
ncbi:MAG TPA: argininosuccinate lyase, partial [Clostridiales bacterium]|nr:argininosuccinate lyase [Clostridiales bacterium]